MVTTGQLRVYKRKVPEYLTMDSEGLGHGHYKVFGSALQTKGSRISYRRGTRMQSLQGIPGQLYKRKVREYLTTAEGLRRSHYNVFWVSSTNERFLNILPQRFPILLCMYARPSGYSESVGS